MRQTGDAGPQLNPNLEIRSRVRETPRGQGGNPKQSGKFKKTIVKNGRRAMLSWFAAFGIRICFEFRILSFEFQHLPTAGDRYRTPYVNAG